MKLTAALIAATLLSVVAPAYAGDVYGYDGGWRPHGHRHGPRHVYAAEAVELVDYREPYLPRGVLYNAPPLPLAYGYASRARYRDVISARY